MTAIAEIDLTMPSGAPVTISWQRGDDHRAERLFRVALFLDLNNALPVELTRLHDHAGILRPCWRVMPIDARVLRVIFEAWSAEGETAVWHMLGSDPRGTPILEDQGNPTLVPSPHSVQRPAAPFMNAPRP